MQIWKQSFHVLNFNRRFPLVYTVISSCRIKHTVSWTVINTTNNLIHSLLKGIHIYIKHLFSLGLCLSHLGEDIAELFTLPFGTDVSSQLEIHTHKNLYTTVNVTWKCWNEIMSHGKFCWLLVVKLWDSWKCSICLRIILLLHVFTAWNNNTHYEAFTLHTVNVNNHKLYNKT
jgi:hypothetical protein